MPYLTANARLGLEVNVRKLALALCFLPSLAHAEPTVAEVEAKANAIISTLRAQRERAADDAANSQYEALMLRSEVSHLSKEIEALKAAKKEGPK